MDKPLSKVENLDPEEIDANEFNEMSKEVISKTIFANILQQTSNCSLMIKENT